MRLPLPYQITSAKLYLGSLDGIETGIRQLIRDEPLETTIVDYQSMRITVPKRSAQTDGTRRVPQGRQPVWQ